VKAARSSSSSSNAGSSSKYGLLPSSCDLLVSVDNHKRHFNSILCGKPNFSSSSNTTTSSSEYGFLPSDPFGCGADERYQFNVASVLVEVSRTIDALSSSVGRRTASS
jgi:hypothetical protein